MLDKLIDFILDVIDAFRFWQVIAEYQRAVVLRLGKFHSELDPGIHWIIPFGVDNVILDNVVPRTCRLNPQSLMTKDGKLVAVSGVITASIRHIRKAVLEVEGVDHALVDACTAAIAEHVTESTFEELRTEEFREKLTKACRSQAFRYGLEIIRVQLSDLSPCRVVRLHMPSRDK